MRVTLWQFRDQTDTVQGKVGVKARKKPKFPRGVYWEGEKVDMNMTWHWKKVNKWRNTSSQTFIYSIPSLRVPCQTLKGDDEIRRKFLLLQLLRCWWGKARKNKVILLVSPSIQRPKVLVGPYQSECGQIPCQTLFDTRHWPQTIFSESHHLPPTLTHSDSPQPIRVSQLLPHK